MESDGFGWNMHRVSGTLRHELLVPPHALLWQGAHVTVEAEEKEAGLTSIWQLESTYYADMS